MPVVWDDHLEYQHQWSRASQSLEASYLYCRGQAAEVMQVLMGARHRATLDQASRFVFMAPTGTPKLSLFSVTFW